MNLQRTVSTPSSEDADPENLLRQQMNTSSDSGDYEVPEMKILGLKRQRQTMSSVSVDTRKILERFLKMKSLNLSSSKRNISIEHQYAVVGDIFGETDPQPTPYQQMEGSDDESMSDFYQNFLKIENMTVNTGEPDYVDCQMLIKELNLEIQKKIHSPPGNVKFAVGIKKKKSSHEVVGQDSTNVASSSSTEDYEVPDTELINRKKKSSFRLALERVRQSFRRQGKKEPNSKLQSTPGEQRRNLPTKMEMPLPPTPKTLNASRAHRTLLREGSHVSKSSATASSSLLEMEMNPGKVEEADAAVLQVGECLSEEKRRKSPMPWRKADVKEKMKEEKVKENSGIFEVILRQFRKGISKSKCKTSSQGKQKFHSTDNLSVHPPTEEEKKLLERFVLKRRSRDVESYLDYAAFRLKQNKDQQIQQTDDDQKDNKGQHLLRQKMTLDGLVLCRPFMPLPTSECQTGADASEVFANVGEMTTSSCLKQKKNNNEAFDANVAEFEMMLSYSSSKPFSLKSDREKEELYEKIAEQLALIADNYNNVDSPLSPILQSLTLPSHEKENSERDLKSTSMMFLTSEAKKDETFTLDSFVSHQQNHLHNKTVYNGSPAVAQLIKTPTYGEFKQIVGEGVGCGENCWLQIANLFRLTGSAIHLAGMGTSAASQIKDMTLRYFEDQYANWIIGQGGWESMVEETNSELD